MISNQEILAAVRRLSKSNLRNQYNRLCRNSGTESRYILQVLKPHLQDILVLADAGKQIAESFEGVPEVARQNYNPGHLSPKLCQRLSKLPQYTHAKEAVKKVVRGLGYADVIGIFLAGESKKNLSSTPSIGFMQKREFINWVDLALDEAKISRADPGIADFQQFAELTKLLHHTTARDCFRLLNQPGVYLQDKTLLLSDCEQLMQMGIRKTPDLAQTSVHVLMKAFESDDAALQRLVTFLAKRNLSLGMKFPPQWK